MMYKKHAHTHTYKAHTNIVTAIFGTWSLT